MHADAAAGGDEDVAIVQGIGDVRAGRHRLFMPGGRVASSLRVRCMRSWRPFCCGWPGLMRSMAMPSLSHQTESLERLNRALGLAKGTPLSERIACGRPR